MFQAIGLAVGILVALGLYALHERFCQRFPLAARILGLVLGGTTTAVAFLFLGQYTNDLYIEMIMVLLTYWGTAFLYGIYYFCIQRISIIQTTLSLILLVSVAFGIILLCEILIDLARGAGYTPTWVLARDMLHMGNIAFLITLLVQVLLAPWFSRKTLRLPETVCDLPH